jgi:hypothetical protein
MIRFADKVAFVTGATATRSAVAIWVVHVGDGPYAPHSRARTLRLVPRSGPARE